MGGGYNAARGQVSRDIAHFLFKSDVDVFKLSWH